MGRGRSWAAMGCLPHRKAIELEWPFSVVLSWEEMASLYSCMNQSLVGGSHRKGPDFGWGGFTAEANFIGAGS